MRSSKQRQRNKQNRNSRPTGGNIINRVFDSSGPEGKVRGTPAQIIEKYLQLHRDAQLAGDRVNAENFAQHAEHYTRLLAEAQRDVDRVREEQEQFQRERQQERDRQMEASRDQQQQRDRDLHREREQQRERERERIARFRAQEEAAGGLADAEPSFLSQPLFPVMVADPQDDIVPDAGLVETPEERAARPERPRRADRNFEGRERRPRRDRDDRQPAVEAPQATPAPEPVAEAPVAETPVAEAPAAAPEAEPVKAERPRRPRKPRAPRAEVPTEAATPDAAE